MINGNCDGYGYGAPVKENPGLLRKRQFSLGYLMLEMFWIAAALGSFRAMTVPDNGLSPALLIGAVASSGAAIGGLFGNMRAGVGWTLAAGMLLSLFLPAVQ
jgi:hypothetical protein